MRCLLLCSVVLLGVVSGTWGHGRLYTPPSRSTCWRKGFAGCVPNYTDQELFCGGYGNQWEKNGGKCGVCGDNWSDPQPRANEAGGRYGKGVIVGNYQAGQQMKIEVQLTAAHMGYFEFRLCKNDDVTKIITHECLNQNVLQLADGSGTRYKVTGYPRMHTVHVKLPPGLTCSQCVLQWKYVTGNRWCCGKDGKCCNGCCEKQEQFYGCADISIS